MSVTLVQPAPDAAAEERWRLWRLAYVEGSRKAARQTGIAFASIVIALAVIALFQLLP